MCFDQSGHDKYQFKCTVIGVTSLILHTLVLCLAITVLIVTVFKHPPEKIEHYFNNSAQMYFEELNKNQFFVLTGVLLVFGVLGIVASVMLIIGSKYRKPGYLVVYICYSSTMSILQLISAILLFLNIHWVFALAALVLSVLSCSVTITVNRCYEAVIQDACRNSFSDLTILIEADASDNISSVPAA